MSRILLVEHNDLNRQMLGDYLVYFGYQVLSLDSGSGFFQALAKFQPNLILLDLRLPDISGHTLLQQLQQVTKWRHIPVIVVTSAVFSSERQRALDLGVRRYFINPVNLTALRQAIQEELDMNIS